MNATETGRFCWAELGTPDGRAARYFYGRVFGWEAKPLEVQTPTGIFLDYRLLQRDGRSIAGLYEQIGEQRAEGAPPDWLPFVSVADVDASAARAVEFGARLALRPLQVFDMGRMAILIDPQGARLALWQPKELLGFQVRGESGSTAWFELVTPEPETAVDFYSSLLGWNAQSVPVGDRPYTLLRAGEEAVAGAISSRGGPVEAEPRWLTYFATDDCDAACKRIASLRGQVLVEPTDVPGIGRYAAASDPHGAAFGLLQAAPAPAT